MNVIESQVERLIFAITGLFTVLREEVNIKIHLIISLVVVMAGIFFDLLIIEWIAVALAIVAVLALEMINSAVERICNFISPEKHEQIKKIKDIAAGSVLLAAGFAFIVGVPVFGPKVLYLFHYSH